MGVDLRLLPVDYEHDRWGYSHTVMDLPRNYDQWQRIYELPKTPLPESFSSFCGEGKDGEHGYGDTRMDPYGSEIKCVTAGELLGTFEEEDKEWAKPQYAYLAALPPETRIALYWH